LVRQYSTPLVSRSACFCSITAKSAAERSTGAHWLPARVAVRSVSMPIRNMIETPLGVLGTVPRSALPPMCT
jgi:hypothetical protein